MALGALLPGFLLFLSFLLPAYGQPPVDSPEEGENFSDFFSRITSGNHRFPGILLDAPIEFQSPFLARFKESAWVGDQDAIARILEKKGADLWFNWFKTDTPLKLALPTAAARAVVEREFEASRLNECKECRSFLFLLDTPWRDWTVLERGLLARIFVLKAKIFSGRRLIDFVAEHYSFPADDALAVLSVQILEHAAFVSSVRSLGWAGEIYFRGLTTVMPSDHSRKIIVLDGDFIRDRTENAYPLYQMFEYIGILTHELNHVFQDLDATRLGIDLNISSPEGALLIEGQAEYVAEVSMNEAGRLLEDPSALNLYVSQQALSLVGKDAGQDFEFFPYRVGLPFLYSVFQMQGKASEDLIRLGVYQTIEGKQTLTSFLRSLVKLP